MSKLNREIMRPAATTGELMRLERELVLIDDIGRVAEAALEEITATEYKKVDEVFKASRKIQITAQMYFGDEIPPEVGIWLNQTIEQMMGDVDEISDQLVGKIGAIISGMSTMPDEVGFFEELRNRINRRLLTG